MNKLSSAFPTVAAFPGTLPDFGFAMAERPEPGATAQLRRIMEAIATAPPDKSLRSLHIRTGESRDAVREVVRALTAPTATHRLETFEIDCSDAYQLANEDDPAFSPWSLTTIPTLREIYVYSLTDVINRRQAAILEESLRSRRLSGCPPLRTIRWTSLFEQVPELFELWGDRADEVGSDLGFMYQVISAESPTTYFHKPDIWESQ